MKPAFLGVVLLFILGGCATTTVGPPETIKVGKTTLTVAGLEGYNRLAVRVPDPNGPNVFILSNDIVIDEEPVRPGASQGRVTIVWRLDASSDAAYSFPDDDAIKLHASFGNPLPSDLDCGAVGAKRRAFICTYTKPEAPREWKYTIRVKNSAGPDPKPLDPWIHQP